MPMLMEKNLQMTLVTDRGKETDTPISVKKREREKVQAYRIEFLTD
jgi:hypothetical protein